MRESSGARHAPGRITAMLVLATLGAAGVGGAGAEQEAPLQELFQTEVVYPQEKGEIQVTVTTRLRRVGQTTAIEVPLTLEYGLTDAWQIEVELNVGGFVALSGGVLTGELNWTSELEHPGRANELYATPGVVRRLGKYVEIGVGVPVGLTGDSDRFRALVRVTVEF